MRRILLTALAVVASASFNAASAGKKSKKDKKNAPVALTTSSDSLSYAAGVAFTDGLAEYVMKTYDVDSTYVPDFLRGLNDMLTSNDKALRAYGAGMEIANRLARQMLPTISKEFEGSPDSLDATLLCRGFTDAVAGDTSVFNPEEAVALFKTKRAADKEIKEQRENAANKDAGERFLAENAVKDSVRVTASGLQYKVLVAGDGDIPARTDRVTVNYEGRLIDGTVFDSSKKHGSKPATFQADKVIKGWTEALTMMPVGSKWQLYIPYGLAYGSRASGKIKPYSALVFDVELVGIENKSKAGGKTGGAKAAEKETGDGQ